jgi:hypothetical protein
MYRWWPVDGRRHAVPDDLDVGDAGATLCGRPVVHTGERFPETDWSWPTCMDCWKTVLRPGHAPRGKA